MFSLNYFCFDSLWNQLQRNVDASWLCFISSHQIYFKMLFCQANSFHLDGVSHLQQMSFILFFYNYKYCRHIAGRWKGGPEKFWFRLRCNSILFSRAWYQPEMRTLSPGCLHFCALQLTTTLLSMCFKVLLIHCCIYCIHSRNYELLNQTKQAEWMKSSDTVALIILIRYLPSSYVLLLLQLSELWPVAEHW